MTNPEVDKLYWDLKFYGKVERLAIGWWASNSKYLTRDLGFLDYEDLMSEAWTHLIEKKEDGQTQAYYLQAIKWKFNELLKKAKRRHEIMPQIPVSQSRGTVLIDGDHIPIREVVYSGWDDEFDPREKKKKKK